jgi:hypothetical protein
MREFRKVVAMCARGEMPDFMDDTSPEGDEFDEMSTEELRNECTSVGIEFKPKTPPAELRRRLREHMKETA